MKTISAIVLSISFVLPVLAQDGSSMAKETEYKVITIVESIVPMGIGRSRMIENKTEMNTETYSTDRTDGKKSDQGDVKRKDLKVDEFTETKMLNFYSATGINFQNIASNDALIGARMNELAKEGWTLAFFASGVESNAGQQDGEGIYITRMVFTR
ncbi:MAG: hypothetical protein O2867_04920 [Bacteroidetes bacterium]|jgi:hypothetical protein|nr:hypothetical protein [Bacteroidota bacterium]